MHPVTHEAGNRLPSPVELYVGPALFSLLSLQCGAVAIERMPCPELIAPDLFAPGETIMVKGESFGIGACDRSVGCASRGMPEPLKDIDIQLRRGTDVWHLVTVDERAFSLRRERRGSPRCPCGGGGT